MEGEPGKTLYTFYETPTFTAKLAKLAGEDALEVLLAIQADLLAAPERWPVVKGTGGARKGRIANPASDRGKSGSFRYLYLFLEHRGRIYLLHFFAKANQSDLNADQKKEIADMIEIIKQANQ
jgi:hypothetical protein